MRPSSSTPEHEPLTVERPLSTPVSPTPGRPVLLKRTTPPSTSPTITIVTSRNARAFHHFFIVCNWTTLGWVAGRVPLIQIASFSTLKPSAAMAVSSRLALLLCVQTEDARHARSTRHSQTRDARVARPRTAKGQQDPVHHFAPHTAERFASTKHASCTREGTDASYEKFFPTDCYRCPSFGVR